MIDRVRESRNPKKVIRVSLMESYGEIGRVPVNLCKIVRVYAASPPRRRLRSVRHIVCKRPCDDLLLPPTFAHMLEVQSSLLPVGQNAKRKA